MSNEIVKSEMSADELTRTAKLLAMSSYFDAKGNSEMAIAQIATKILAGRELGYGPFTSVQGIFVIQGRPSLSANLMAAAVKNSPRYDYRVRKLDATECIIEFFERCADGKRESLGVSTFTLEDARKAQVKNMDKFPRNMLFARAISNGVRFYVPDVFSGNSVYTPDELGAETDESGVIIVVGEPGRTVDSSTGEVVEKMTQSKPKQLNGNAPATDHSIRRVSAVEFVGSQQAWEEITDEELDKAVKVQTTDDGSTTRLSEPTSERAYVNPLAELEDECETLGVAYYADKWDNERSKLILWLTYDRTSAMSKTTETELVALKKKLGDKIAKHGTAAQAEIRAITGGK